MANRKSKLTRRQKEVLDFIKRFVKKNEYPPTRQDIMKHFGFRSPNSVTDFLKALESKGFIEVVPETARGIKVK